MASLRVNIFPDSHLLLIGQDLSRREGIPGFGGNHGHLIGSDIKAAESPFPGEPAQDDNGNRGNTDGSD